MSISTDMLALYCNIQDKLWDGWVLQATALPDKETRISLLRPGCAATFAAQAPSLLDALKLLEVKVLIAYAVDTDLSQALERLSFLMATD